MCDLNELYRLMGAREVAKAAIKIHRPDLVKEDIAASPEPKVITIDRHGNAAEVEPEHSALRKLLYRAWMRK
jgi:hypothetical protein